MKENTSNNYDTVFPNFKSGPPAKPEAWVALEGYITDEPSKGAPKRFADCISFSGYPSRGFIYAFLFSLPVNGSMYSLRLIWSAIWSSSNWRFMYYFVLSYLHNSLLPRNVYFHICTLNLRVCRKSLANFFLWGIPLSVIRCTLMVYLLAYAHDQDTICFYNFHSFLLT